MTDRILSIPRNIQDVLDRLTNAKDHNGYWTADCPVPGHKTPKGHLSVKDSGDKVLVTCQGNHGHDYNQICQALGFDSLTYGADDGKPGTVEKRLVQTFSYQDIDGKEVYQVRRYEPKDFKVFHLENGEYVPGLGRRKPILYKLPQLTEWIQQGRAINIPEGERKVDRLIELGLAATTAPFGAGKHKWHAAYSHSLAGANIVILPDNDKPGRAYGEEKAISLSKVAKGVKVLLLPNLPPRGDIVDWLEAGGTREELERLTRETPEWRPKTTGQDLENVRLIRMADVQAESVNWLWEPYIPRAKVTLLEGDPGVGKSWLSLAISTAVSLGKGLPGQNNGNPASVLLASAEDGLGDTIRPRLDTMKADLSRVFAVDGLFTLDDSGLAMLEGYIVDNKPMLVVLDPLVGYISAAVDIHRSNEVRAVMSKLAALAEKYKVAILAIRHLTKGGMAKPIYRGLGSIDFTAACRSVLLAGYDPANPQSRGLVHIKSNLAPTGDAIGFEITDGSFYWTGNSDLTAAKILAVEDSEGKSAFDEATEFLKEELENGPVEARQVLRDARNVSIAERTLKRAKDKLGIKTSRRGKKGKRGGGKFIWELPADTHLEGQKDLGCQECQVDNFGTLNKNRHENAPLQKSVGTLNPEKGGIENRGDLEYQHEHLNPDKGEHQGQSIDHHETTVLPPEYPISYCPVCGSGDYWLREANHWGEAEWVCSRCHPKPT